MKPTQHVQQSFYIDRESGFSLDWSAGLMPELEFAESERQANEALQEMAELEGGSIANPDEDRMVGHYWLRSPERAPDPAITSEIQTTRDAVLKFCNEVQQGAISASDGKPFTRVVLAGIGGSALGPQFLDMALRKLDAPLTIYYLDNTDPAGLADAVAEVGDLARALTVVISKSGGTRETRNAMLYMEAAYAKAGVAAARHMVAVTQEGSKLDTHAQENGWLKRFPMWDWVGGRTSLWSAVGLVPAGLAGIDCEALLKGAAHMDSLTRAEQIRLNPALVMALHWYHLGNGKGERALVMLPYRDQLEKLSKYMQQLVMESIGKTLDRDGKTVHQGLYVLGNKGSTDQHSYVQQLRDGLDNFIAHFVEVRCDGPTRSAPESTPDVQAIIEEAATAGDYLLGFLQGTRAALKEAGRPGLLLSIPEVNAFTVGMLLALFERAVGFYATLINVNAYHQPGVEAGKKAAGRVIEVQHKVVAALGAEGLTAAEIADKADVPEFDYVFAILRHLAANERIRVTEGATVFEDRYSR